MKKATTSFAGDLSPPGCNFIFVNQNINIMKRKSIVLFAVSIIISITAFSQLEKGTWLVGGNFSYTSSKNNSDAGSKTKAYTLSVYPNVGYFVAKKFVLGIRSAISKEASKATGTSVYSKYTDFNLGPFARYYFLEKESTVNVLLESGYQFGFTKGDYLKNNHSVFYFSAGPAIYFNSSAAIEFLIGYSTYKIKNYAGSNNTISVSIGLQFYLEKEK
jgi:hypothetical protein